MANYKEESTVKVIFRTLSYRNFRLFFIGQGISVIGTWMQQIAMGWLVYRLTNSAFLLGVVGFASQIPTFIFSPFAGVMADRWRKYRILIITQTLAMIQAFILAALTLTGKITVWEIITLGIAMGCINSFDIPTRQSFIVEMVEKKENLGNAIALNSFMFNAARLVGPSIAGIIIAVSSEGVCFLINGISFLAVIAALLAMKVSSQKIRIERPHVLKELKEGFAYVFGFAPIRFILLLLGVISLTGASYVVLMPVFARDVLKGGPSTLGFLMSAVGVGALIATLYLASRKSILGLGRVIPAAASVFAAGLILFALSHTLWISLALLVVIGFGFMATTAASNTILQTIAEDDKRGRVMSFYAMAFMGMMPIGSFLAGVLASKIGATNALIVGGVVCILASLAFARKLSLVKKLIHPIYKKIGIIQEVASGISTATGMPVPPENIDD